MSFINTCSTVLRLSNKHIFHILYDNNLRYEYFDDNNILIDSGIIYDKEDINFSDFNFSLYNDNIYGLINDKELLMIRIENNIVSIKALCDYDNDNFNITFPYIKIIDNDTHIMYYVYHVNNPNQCALFHQFKSNGCWSEHKIDFVSHQILNEFIVTWNKSTPTIFYIKLVDEVEQIFCSRFNLSTLSWSKPIQITHSRNNKLYLSVIKDNINFYHIAFCEKLDSMYSVKFLNGYLLDNEFDVINHICVSDSDLNMYPCLLKEGKYDIYLTWVNYNKLYSCHSNDLGKTWEQPKVDDLSLGNEFTRCRFNSNFSNDSLYNTNCLFTIKNEIDLIGF